MNPSRLAAFTDGVLAIVITIMVLELRAPHDAGLTSLRPLVPVATSYVLSFVYLVIYWNNHHHLLHVTHRVTGGILWANAHLLFWLSLVPFVTAWMGETRFAPVPMAAYGVVLFLAGIAYLVLQRAIIASEGPASVLAAAVGGDRKGKLSLLLYAMAIPLAFVRPWIAGTLYVSAALMWLTPDRRIERMVAAPPHLSRSAVHSVDTGIGIAHEDQDRALDEAGRRAGKPEPPTDAVPVPLRASLHDEDA